MIDQASRAIKAQALLDNDLLKEVFTKLESEAMEGILSAGDDDNRRHMIDKVKTIRGVYQSLKTELDKARINAKGRPLVP